MLLSLVLIGIGAPPRLIDQKQDVEEAEDVGEHHDEHGKVEEYQRFVTGVPNEAYFLSNTWIEVGVLGKADLNIQCWKLAKS